MERESVGRYKIIRIIKRQEGATDQTTPFSEM
jgi:hypothetical protein